MGIYCLSNSFRAPIKTHKKVAKKAKRHNIEAS
jgi:hypothetical protein